MIRSIVFGAGTLFQYSKSAFASGDSMNVLLSSIHKFLQFLHGHFNAFSTVKLVKRVLNMR